MDRADSCCFTGHRSSRLPWGDDETNPRCLDLKERLAGALEGAYNSGCRHFICGMAQGSDLYFAEAVLELRSRFPDVTLEAAIPCDRQADRWSDAQQRRYEHIMAECDTVTFVQHQYSSGCMMRRNRYMVDHSSLLLACFDGQTGGTMNTILYAQRQGLTVILIDL